MRWWPTFPADVPRIPTCSKPTCLLPSPLHASPPRRPADSGRYVRANREFFERSREAFCDPPLCEAVYHTFCGTRNVQSLLRTGTNGLFATTCTAKRQKPGEPTEPIPP